MIMIIVDISDAIMRLLHQESMNSTMSKLSTDIRYKCLMLFTTQKPSNYVYSSKNTWVTSVCYHTVSTLYLGVASQFIRHLPVNTPFNPAGDIQYLSIQLQYHCFYRCKISSQLWTCRFPLATKPVYWMGRNHKNQPCGGAHRLFTACCLISFFLLNRFLSWQHGTNIKGISYL